MPACPLHVTLGRRYKALTSQLKAFTEYIAALQFAKEAGFLQHAICEDKSLLFKAAGPVWHQKDRLNDHLPKDLRGVDKTATWSKSGYHGWVYGYGLYLTGIRNGFPVMFQVLRANVNELPSNIPCGSSILATIPLNFQVCRGWKSIEGGVCPSILINLSISQIFVPDGHLILTGPADINITFHKVPETRRFGQSFSQKHRIKVVFSFFQWRISVLLKWLSYFQSLIHDKLQLVHGYHLQ